tara:strand:- start:938 stop:1102 length:165 start_codon:yes stop_codon:yes gene_type:complete
MSKKEQKRQKSRDNLRLLKKRVNQVEESKLTKPEEHRRVKSCLAFIYRLFGKTD